MKNKILNMKAGLVIAYDVAITGTNYRESCNECIYRRALSRSGPKYMTCHYCYDTGKPRNCPADHCDKKRRKA